MTIHLEGDNLQKGLLGLVVALVEIVEEVLQRQALHRIDAGSLGNEEAEKLGLAFMQLDKALEQIKQDYGIGEAAHKIRTDLDALVNDSLTRIMTPQVVEHAR